MAHIGGNGLVEGDPVIHQIGEVVKKDGGVVQVPADNLPVAETALRLQGIGQISMVDGGVDPDARFLQRGDQPTVIVDPRRIDVSDPLRQDAGPGEGQAVGLDTQLAELGHVPLDVVIGVAAEVRDTVVFDLAGQAAEHVPDGGAAPVLKAASARSSSSSKGFRRAYSGISIGRERSQSSDAEAQLYHKKEWYVLTIEKRRMQYQPA